MFKGNFPAIALAGYVFLIFVGLMGISDAAFASTAGPAGGPGLPWENTIQMLIRSISGPVAYGFGVFALFAFTVGWAFGDEMTGALKKLLNVVIGISGLMFVVPFIGALFVGALIP